MPQPQPAEPEAHTAATTHLGQPGGVDPESDPEVGGADGEEEQGEEGERPNYIAMAECVIRESAAMDSRKLGNLRIGEVIAETEHAELEDGTMRVKFDRHGWPPEGWTSVMSTAGKQLLKPTASGSMGLVVQEGGKQPGSAGDGSDDGARSFSVAVDGVDQADFLLHGGNSNFTARGTKGLKLKGKGYHKKRLNLSVGGMGVTIFEGSRPVDTYGYLEMISWEFNRQVGADEGHFKINRRLTGEQDSRGPQVIEVVMAEQLGKQICAQMSKIATEVAAADKQRKEEAKNAPLAPSQPTANASKEISANHLQSVGQGIIGADESFDVQFYSQKRPLKLKVGEQGLNIFEHNGMTPVNSWHYFNMVSWEFSKSSQKLTVEMKEEPGAKPSKKKSRAVELRTSDGATICAVMEERAAGLAAARRQERQKKKQMARDMEGVYKVTYPEGVMVREHAALDSPKVAVVAEGEHVLIDKVLRNFEGKFVRQLII